MNYAEQSRSPTRHLVGGVIVIGFHILLIYALVEGLGSNIIEKLKPPIETKIVQQETKPPPPPPPPPPPQLAAPPPPFIPPPEINVQPPPQQTVIQAVTRVAPPAQAYHPTAPTPTAPAQPDRDVSERPIAGAPLQYPPQMQEEEREGSARVSCNVGADGTTSGCKIDSVSGGSAFGAAALNYVRTARYRPRTHNGVAQAAAHQWNIRFSLGGG